MDVLIYVQTNIYQLSIHNKICSNRKAGFILFYFFSASKCIGLEKAVDFQSTLTERFFSVCIQMINAVLSAVAGSISHN